MAKTPLAALFHPSSVALFGASTVPDSMGHPVMKNLLSGGFQGPLLPVNPKYSSVHGVLCYKGVADLPLTPDLAIICTPPDTVPGIIEKLAERGTRVAVVLTADPEGGGPDTTLKNRLRALGMTKTRVLGPGSTGVLVPAVGLNGTWASSGFKRGRVALVSQSGAVSQSVMHWGENHGVGFSCVLSTGDSVDVDIGELVDHLAEEPSSRAILLYLQQLHGARRFLSAVRAAAKLKPVIVIRSGRRNRANFDANSDGTPSVPVDLIFDAAFNRAGLLRVLDLDELLDAVENLAYGKPLLGERLLIVSNGAGTAETAADTHVLGGGVMASINPEAAEKLRAMLPERCVVSNPLDLGRDAGPERYREALRILVAAQGIDAFLVMHTPTSVSPEKEVALAVAETTAKTQRNVLSCWLGGDTGGDAHAICQGAGIPVFSTPDKAARAFLHMVRYRRNQELLLETPAPPPTGSERRLELARAIVEGAKGAGRENLNEEESANLLNAYSIECEPIRNAADVEEAKAWGEALEYPVALKVASRAVVRSPELGGVVFGLSSPEALAKAASMLAENFANARPDEAFPGFVLQKRVWKPHALLFMAGIAVDRVFGPVLYLGRGGATGKSSAEVVVGLPPLNMKLAEDLVMGLKDWERTLPDPVERAGVKKALVGALIRLSQLLEDVPELVSLEINPLLADSESALAADARFKISAMPRIRFAISPYPRELEERLALRGGKETLVRPIRPEDEDKYVEFLAKMSDEDLQKRFFTVAKNIPKAQINTVTSIDFEREMAFVALDLEKAGGDIIGIVNIKQTIDNSEAEYAIIVRSDYKAVGLGRALMEKIIRYCKARKIGAITGYVLKNNFGMLGLCFKLGFSAHPMEDDDIMSVRLELSK